MLSLSSQTRVFMWGASIDLRKGFEGLSALVESHFPQQLFTGAYFAFVNRASNRIKVLYWDVDGLAIWCKRLEKGTFSKKMAKEEMSRRDFFLLLEGVIPKKTTPRFSIKKSVFL